MTHEPGTVAVATVRGVPNVRVFRVAQLHANHVYLWASDAEVENTAHHKDSEVTDVRPLVLLDLDPTLVGEAPFARRTEAQFLTDFLRETADHFLTKDAAKLARKVADQIEAQSKPPRIPEPGLWAVVRDNGDDVWVCTEPHRWTRLVDGVEWPWVDISDPVLIRDGIEES